jgi:hypothetical protein
MTPRPTAFVAMKFTVEHWKDARYQAIRDVLDAAGYNCIRGDEIKSSGPVVDEVCRHLSEAELVLIDVSGDSHSVSYEVGYCHGAQRPAAKTLIVSQTNELPFNYRHFRVRQYKDTRGLRRLIRDFLSMSEPLRDDQYGYTFTFNYVENAGFGYIADGAEAVLDAVADTNFSGRMECFSGELYFGSYRTFAVSFIGRSQPSNKSLGFDYWSKIQDSLETYIAKHSRITLEEAGCELSRKAAIKASLVYCGSAEYVQGHLVRIIDSSEGETFFDDYVERKNTEA